MKDHLTLKCSVDEILSFLDSRIDSINKEDDTENIPSIIKNIENELTDYINCKELIIEFRRLSGYIHNQFSEIKNNESINLAKERVLLFLNDLRLCITEERMKFIDYNLQIDNDTSILILKKILNNFYEHIKAMYIDEVHGKGSITKENLEKINIRNEYDVQRILFSLIKPIFTDARTEVVEDAGCSSIRYDIDIESCNTTIEVKCTRSTMNERKLNEEIGSDSFHYTRKNILFFVYDKEGIISNIDSYKKMYNKKFDGKSIDIIILQPVKL